MTIGRTLRTVRQLRARQIAYYIQRRLLPVRGSRLRLPASISRRAGVRLAARPCVCVPCAAEATFTFVGQTLSFDEGTIDWHPVEANRLWRYNLHYFDYLLDESRSLDTRDHLISDWIAYNPLGTADGWEPYSTSLRIVNWVTFFLRSESARALDPAWLRSLYGQALWLERNIEYHILANHYLKNGLAMLFAGTFFVGADAERWLALGLRILCEETEEQMLADGGHYERSAMYHAIACQDVLDALNLFRADTVMVPDDVIRRLEAKAEAGIRYLFDILHPDGEIPLFNDAAMGIAPSAAALAAYAATILGRPVRLAGDSPAVINKPDTGYFGVRAGEDILLVDCGALGPDYQPGHGHCDTLSFELSLDGRRVVVDSGTHGYENDELRAILRGTAAHNTVKVEASEQSEIWAAFRVGRRAKPITARIDGEPSGEIVFTGAHDGYHHLRQRVTHERTIHYRAPDQVLCVTDTLSGTGAVSAESFLHLAPGLEPRDGGRDLIVVEENGRAVFKIDVVNADAVRLAEAPYCPRFGERVCARVVIFRRRARMPFDFGYSLRKAAT